MLQNDLAFLVRIGKASLSEFPEIFALGLSVCRNCGGGGRPGCSFIKPSKRNQYNFVLLNLRSHQKSLNRKKLQFKMFGRENSSRGQLEFQTFFHSNQSKTLD